MSLRDALKLTNKLVKIDDMDVVLRRPSIADLVEAIEVSGNPKIHFAAWTVLNHLLEENKPMFSSLEEVMICDFRLVEKIGKEIDILYNEGRDLPAQS